MTTKITKKEMVLHYERTKKIIQIYTKLFFYDTGNRTVP